MPINTANYKLVHKILRTQAFAQLDQGGDGGDNIPIQTPNVKIDSPNNSSWLEISFTPLDKARADIGGVDAGRYRYRGVMVVIIRTPAAEGDDVLLQLADRIEAAFRSQTLTDSGTEVVLQTPAMSGSPFVDPPWYRATLLCPFYSDSHVT